MGNSTYVQRNEQFSGYTLELWNKIGKELVTQLPSTIPYIKELSREENNSKIEHEVKLHVLSIVNSILQNSNSQFKIVETTVYQRSVYTIFIYNGNLYVVTYMNYYDKERDSTVFDSTMRNRVCSVNQKFLNRLIKKKQLDIDDLSYCEKEKKSTTSTTSNTISSPQRSKYTRYI